MMNVSRFLFIQMLLFCSVCLGQTAFSALASGELCLAQDASHKLFVSWSYYDIGEGQEIAGFSNNLEQRPCQLETCLCHKTKSHPEFFIQVYKGKSIASLHIFLNDKPGIFQFL